MAPVVGAFVPFVALLPYLFIGGRLAFAELRKMGGRDESLVQRVSTTLTMTPMGLRVQVGEETWAEEWKVDFVGTRSVYSRLLGSRAARARAAN